MKMGKEEYFAPSVVVLEFIIENGFKNSNGGNLEDPDYGGEIY